MKRWIVALVAATLAAGTAGALGTREPVRKTYEGVRALSVEAERVDVEVVARDGRGTALLTTQDIPWSVTVRHRMEGSTLVVEVESDDSIIGMGTDRPLIRLELPASCDADIATASGDVEVQGMEASLRIVTASGDARASDCSSRIALLTVSGDINVDGCEAGLILGTTSGDVVARDSSGGFSLRTTSGDILLDDCSGTVAASSASGDIVVRGFELKGDSSFETISGDVALYLDNDEDELSLDASTTSGELSVGGVEFQGRARLGSGPIVVTAHTVSGDIVFDED